MLRVFIPMAAGVLLAAYVHINPVIVTAIMGLVLAVAFLGNTVKTQYRFRWIWGIVYSALSMLCGIVLMQAQQPEERKDFLLPIGERLDVYKATLLEPPVARQRSYKAVVSLEKLDSNKQWKTAEGNVILYLQKSDTAATLVYGSQIVFDKPLEPIKNSPNPGAFDYKGYCRREGIFYQAYVKSGDYVVMKTNAGNAFRRMLYNARQSIHDALFIAFVQYPAALGLSEALITGYRGDMDKEMVEHFANTGVVHVIAISGMHLALIFALLQLLCKPLRYNKKLRLLSPVIVLTGIWFFCLLTGAAPSAVRAAIMLSVLVLGQMGNRQSNTINALAFAATLQLLIDPYSLWQVGFQLSYSAVLSIAIFYKPIALLLWHRNKIVRAVMQMMSVTIAAQILTLPLALYHFHQMPVYFLLSNMVVVPLITVVVYALLLLLLLGLFMPVQWLATPIAWLINLVTSYVSQINALPGNRLSNVLFTAHETILLYVFIALLSEWLLRRRMAVLPWAILSLIVLLLTGVHQYFTQSRNNQLMAYYVPGMHAFDISERRKTIFVGDSMLIPDGFLQRFHLLPSRIAAQHFPVKSYAIQNHPFQEIIYHGEKLVIADSSPDYSHIAPSGIDWLVPGPALYTDPVKLLQKIQPNGVLIDGATPQYRHARWHAAADSLHLRLHNISLHGPFIIKGR